MLVVGLNRTFTRGLTDLDFDPWPYLRLAYLGMSALMEMSTKTNCNSYAALFSHCAGPAAGPILELRKRKEASEEPVICFFLVRGSHLSRDDPHFSHGCHLKIPPAPPN